MKTLEQIREENKNCQLLFSDMEEKPIELPSVLKKREIEVYQNFIKPNSKKTWINNIK